MGARIMKKPIPVIDPHFDNLIAECQKYIDAMPTNADFPKAGIFEAAIEAVFGENAWEWIMDHKVEARYKEIMGLGE
jgi:hypothetical protein